jgi:hypothetical protein
MLIFKTSPSFFQRLSDSSLFQLAPAPKLAIHYFSFLTFSALFLWEFCKMLGRLSFFFFR